MSRRLKLIEWLKKSFFCRKTTVYVPVMSFKIPFTYQVYSLDDLGLVIDSRCVPGEKFSVFHPNPLTLKKCIALNSSGEPCRYFQTRDSYCGRHHKLRTIPQLVNEYLSIPHPQKKHDPPYERRCCAVGLRMNMVDSNGICRYNSTSNYNVCGYHKAHVLWNKTKREKLKQNIIERISPVYIYWLMMMAEKKKYIPPPSCPRPRQCGGGATQQPLAVITGWKGTWDQRDMYAARSGGELSKFFEIM